MGLAARVRAAIAYKDLNQPVVAKRLNVSSSTVARWQAGTDKPPDDKQLEQLARLCDVPMDFLLFGFEVVSDAAQAIQLSTKEGTERLAALERRIEALEQKMTQAEPPASFTNVSGEKGAEAVADAVDRLGGAALSPQPQAPSQPESSSATPRRKSA